MSATAPMTAVAPAPMGGSAPTPVKPIDAIPWPENLDYGHQSYIVPDSRRPEYTGELSHHTRKAPWLILLPFEQLSIEIASSCFLDHVGYVVANRFPSLPALWAPKHFPNGLIPLNTLPQLFEAGLARSGPNPFLGHRPVLPDGTLSKEFVWQTWNEVDKRRRNVGSALEYVFRTKGLKSGEFQTVGLWSGNRPEWQIVDTACQAYDKVSVSLYDTLGPDVVEYVVNHAEVPIIFAAKSKLNMLLALAPKIPVTKIIVSMDPLNSETRSVLTAWASEKGIELMEMEEFEALGQAHLIHPLPVTPDTIATICYTSGTTNVPKGAVLSHRNLASAALAGAHGISMTEGAAVLSYLPLAHIYERCVELLAIGMGARIGFFSGDPLRLLEDAQILKPYFVASVPRVLNRIYQAAMQAGKAPGIKGAMFRKACDVKLKQLHATGNNKHLFWDALVFRKIQAVLGGNVGVIVCGSAPISRDCMDFIKIAFGCMVVEGYGLTETCATATLNWPSDPSSTGTIGAPRVPCEIKLRDVPEMHYTSQDKPFARGEILIRGHNVFLRYHKDEKNTREALDDEGWFHTGDVAEVDDAGRFRIVDRIKNIMKLAQGEYVALEKVENVYSACPVVAQVYVHGDSLQDHLLAVVVPDPVVLADELKSLGMSLDPTDVIAVAKLIEHPKVADVVLANMTKTAKRAGLNGFETVKAIHMTLDPFTIENGLLTPTFKVRRRDAAETFKDVLHRLYNRDRA